MKHLCIVLIALYSVSRGSAEATEPNESLETATLLPPGIRSVADELSTPATFPDTFLAVLTPDGETRFENDDDSIYGDGLASGLQNVPVQSGTIRFLITGTGDFELQGFHDQSGQFEAFVDVFDISNQPVGAFREVRMLEPGVTFEFLYTNSEWSQHRYNVNIDNTIARSDVDFFKFTGLTPGEAFSTKTLDPSASGIDTLIGWFDDDGELSTSDDDSGGEGLSMLRGVVPLSGILNFAVTGSGDIGFTGAHMQGGDYELHLTLDSPLLTGDYNRDGAIDAADYTVWRDSFDQQVDAFSGADGDGDGVVDEGDYTVWKSHFGQVSANNVSGLAQSITSVPEPAAWLCLATGALLLLMYNWRLPHSTAIY